jgi:hypothetical protein
VKVLAAPGMGIIQEFCIIAHVRDGRPKKNIVIDINMHIGMEDTGKIREGFV